MDFAKARRTMVDTQVRTNDVTDRAVLDVLIEIPREDFLPRALRELAYLDKDLPVGGDDDRWLMQPMVLAKLLQSAAPVPTDRVLDVGCATGYSSALLARLAARVTALECDEGLAAQATTALAGLANVAVVRGPLAEGYAAAAPFDLIMLEGAAEVVPDGLFAQLANGGRLVAVIGAGRSGQATVFVKSHGSLSARRDFDTAVAPLPDFKKIQRFRFY